MIVPKGEDPSRRNSRPVSKRRNTSASNNLPRTAAETGGCVGGRPKEDEQHRPTDDQLQALLLTEEQNCHSR
ncbi:hypothetical protein L798_03216 [Zootermopsis nevadensis]|uniref:Uncharacterized protein n=1 Tax=Zootermopsis nevadensis TaxID=136037 RepID=A0A067QGK3_ZOONE|nr:hypothetical protein L798_03216 [Zootermopsis nevadensis]